MKSSKLTLISTFAAMMLVTACGGDNDSTSISCDEHEIESAGACACDNANKYYGTVGSCTLCEGTGKIVKDNSCVCDDTNFEDDETGGCKQKTTLTCGEHEIESSGACTCDNSNKYYGTVGSCKLCDGTGKTVKENECVCDNENHYYYNSTNKNCELCSSIEFMGSCVKQAGDIVTFGNYKQWPDEGATDFTSLITSPIEWIVLEKDETNRRLFLLSRFALDVKSYHAKEEIAVWKDAEIRKWLNNDFLNNAFDSNEQSYIVNTYCDFSTGVSDNCNTWKEQVGDNISIDKIVLLGVSDVLNYEDLHDNSPLKKGISYCCSTAYSAKDACLDHFKDKTWHNNNVFLNTWITNSDCISDDWLLRNSNGSTGKMTECVFRGNGTTYQGYNCDKPITTPAGIRPAIWVKY